MTKRQLGYGSAIALFIGFIITLAAAAIHFQPSDTDSEIRKAMQDSILLDHSKIEPAEDTVVNIGRDSL